MVTHAFVPISLCRSTFGGLLPVSDAAIPARPPSSAPAKSTVYSNGCPRCSKPVIPRTRKPSDPAVLIFRTSWAEAPNAPTAIALPLSVSAVPADAAADAPGKPAASRDHGVSVERVAEVVLGDAEAHALELLAL